MTLLVHAVIYRIAGRASGGRRRLGISIYAADESKSPVSNAPGGSRSSSNSSAAANTSSTPLAVLQLTASRSRRRQSWQRLLLPTTYVQDALDSGGGVVRLRVVCNGCDAFGRRLVVAPSATATSSVDERTGDEPSTPYLEVVAKRSLVRRRHRHRLCPASDSDAVGSRLATIRRRRC